MFSRFPLFFLFLCSVFLLFSCQRDEDSVWFAYAETQCADEWILSPIMFNSVKDAVEHYLTNTLQITFEEVQYDPDASNPQTCQACTCLSGDLLVQPDS